MIARTCAAVVATAAVVLTMAGCAGSTPSDAPSAGESVAPATVQLDSDTSGSMEYVNNIYNTSIVSNDPNAYKAEYEAGYVQGQLQKDMIPAGRDNSWDGSYLTGNPKDPYPKQLPPSKDELAAVQRTLMTNWDATMDYIRTQAKGDVKKNMRRLLYRLVGIYDGATESDPQALPFDDTWYPTFTAAELEATYGTPSITFTDLYYLNTTGDNYSFFPGPAVPPRSASPEPTVSASADRPDSAQPSASHCTAFVKVTPKDIYLTHNTWAPFQDQSQALQLWVNGTFMSVNAMDPGYLGSGTDFGYNNAGIMFNETTEDNDKNVPKVDALWTMWRETLAEQYSTSIQDFFDYVTLGQSGTYMNGYMIVDTKTDDLGYVEMSQNTAVFYLPSAKGGVKVSTKPAGRDTSYDHKMVTPDYILGFNYPASHLIRKQTQAENNRPARQVQLLAGMPKVDDIEAAKSLITYTAPDNPLSIYGRWDLGYGVTTTPKTVPEGSIDAKAVSASMVQESFDLKGVLDPNAGQDAFWMKFGTASVDGKPFIWSESQWKDQPLRYVPDVVAGPWTMLGTNIR